MSINKKIAETENRPQKLNLPPEQRIKISPNWKLPPPFKKNWPWKTNILYNYLGYFYHIIIEIFLSKKIDLIWYCNVFFNREYNKSYTSSSSSIHLEVNRSSIILNYLGYTRGGLGAGPPPTRAPALRRGGRHGGLI